MKDLIIKSIIGEKSVENNVRDKFFHQNFESLESQAKRALEKYN